MGFGFSVVVPAYNVEGYLERALSSVLRQESSRGIEIVVIDDGSEDRTLSLTEKILSGFPNTKIISQKNSGQSAARNRGIRESSGDYILFLDADDELCDGLIKNFDNFLSYAPDIIFSSRLKIKDGTGEELSKVRFKTVATSPIEFCPEVFKILAIHGKAYRRDFLIGKNLMFSEGVVWEDFGFTYRSYRDAVNVSLLSDFGYRWYERVDEHNPSTMQKLLTNFSLSSRFVQLQETLAVSSEKNWIKKFNGTDWIRREFETTQRILLHVKALMKANDLILQENALQLISDGLEPYKAMIRTHVRPEYKLVYEAIFSKRIHELDEAWYILTKYLDRRAAAKKAPSDFSEIPACRDYVERLNLFAARRVQRKWLSGEELSFGFFIMKASDSCLLQNFDFFRGFKSFQVRAFVFSIKYKNGRSVLLARSYRSVPGLWPDKVRPKYAYAHTKTMQTRELLKYEFDVILSDDSEELRRFCKKFLGSALQVNSLSQLFGYLHRPSKEK